MGKSKKIPDLKRPVLGSSIVDAPHISHLWNVVEYESAYGEYGHYSNLQWLSERMVRVVFMPDAYGANLPTLTNRPA